MMQPSGRFALSRSGFSKRGGAIVPQQRTTDGASAFGRKRAEPRVPSGFFFSLGDRPEGPVRHSRTSGRIGGDRVKPGR